MFQVTVLTASKAQLIIIHMHIITNQNFVLVLFLATHFHLTGVTACNMLTPKHTLSSSVYSPCPTACRLQLQICAPCNNTTSFKLFV